MKLLFLVAALGKFLLILCLKGYFVGLAAYSNASPTSFDQLGVSLASDFLQYVMPVVPPSEVLFSQGIITAVGKCFPTTLAVCQVHFGSRKNIK
jgi:hypothetical protein